MAKIKVFAEIDFLFDVDIPGLNEETLEHEVQEYKLAIYNLLRDKLRSGLKDEEIRKISYFEFDVVRKGEKLDYTDNILYA